jgi:PAS domain S-box-containing protein
MGNLISGHMLVVFFIYGLAFFLFGIAILLQPRRGSAFNIGNSLWLLAGFGLLHSVAEWMDMFLTLGEAYWTPLGLKVIKIAAFYFGAASFVCLLQFGTRVILRNRSKYKFLERTVLAASLSFMVAVSLYGISTGFSGRWLLLSQILMRYLVGFPGAILTAIVFWKQRKLPEIQGFSSQVDRSLMGIAAAFALYGFLAGLVVPSASFFPASVLNYATFADVLGMPVQIFRAAAALLAAYFITGILNIFDLESNIKLEKAHATLLAEIPLRNQLEATLRQELAERKRATQALEASESELRALFAGITDLIFVLDAEGRFLRLAPTDPNHLYKPAAKVIGRTVHEVFSKEQAAYFLGHIRGALRENRMHRVEYSMQIEGTEFWFEGSVSPMSRDSVVWIGRDITERKHAAQALIKNEERLQQSQKMEAIGTLAGGVAHDFNNLLTVILANTEIALGNLQPADFVGLRLVQVEKAAKRAAVLTRQLLAFSRRQQMERRTIDLNDTISEIMKLLHRIIGADVEVKVKVDPNLSAVFADPAQIEQVVMNLAVNARDAMPHGGQLNIETSNIVLDESYQRLYPYAQPGQYVQITVSDSGSGMDEKTKARLFEPFFTTKEVGRGTGLGLSMVYGIVKQHDGHVNVYSEVGHGTTFKIFLPIDERAVEKEAQAIQLPLLGGTETILVAEDEEDLRNLARDVLEGLGYTVLLARDGHEAVEMYAENPERIDMLLLDVVMPRLGGTVAHERMRQLGGDVPTIFMTGYSSETVQSRFVKQNKSLEESEAVVIQKPYSVEALGRKIREVLDASLAKVLT